MRDILEEMANKVPGGFFWFDILLSAYITIFTLQLCIAIETILFPPFFKMTQPELILLKIVKFGWLCMKGIINVRKDRVISLLKKQ